MFKNLKSTELLKNLIGHKFEKKNQKIVHKHEELFHLEVIFFCKNLKSLVHSDKWNQSILNVFRNLSHNGPKS